MSPLSYVLRLGLRLFDKICSKRDCIELPILDVDVCIRGIVRHWLGISPPFLSHESRDARLISIGIKCGIRTKYPSHTFNIAGDF